MKAKITFYQPNDNYAYVTWYRLDTDNELEMLEYGLQRFKEDTKDKNFKITKIEID